MIGPDVTRITCMMMYINHLARAIMWCIKPLASSASHVMRKEFGPCYVYKAKGHELQ